MNDSVVGSDTPTITILKTSLEKRRYYKLVANGNTYKSAVGSAEYVFFTNCPPHSGTCTVTPDSGNTFCSLCLPVHTHIRLTALSPGLPG